MLAVRRLPRASLLLALVLLALHGLAVTADAVSVLCFGRDGHVDVESRARHHDRPGSFAARASFEDADRGGVSAPRGNCSDPCVDAGLIAPAAAEWPQQGSGVVEATELIPSRPTVVPRQPHGFPGPGPSSRPAQPSTVQTTVLRV